MKAGFSKVDISPPPGTPLLGVGESMKRLSTTVHDPVCVRALWLEHRRERALILSFDLCFLGREDVDRFKGVLARELDLTPAQALFSATHTHAGPAIGSYLDMEYAAPSRDYLRELEAAVLRAAREAHKGRREVHLRAGLGRTTVPVNRRQRRDGKVINAPNLGGGVLDSLPLCLFEDAAGAPVCLLFSISTHPVAMRGPEVSADYPGVAMKLLDEKLGASCSLFLQGAAGDSRPRQLIVGDDWTFVSTWPPAEESGGILAREVLATLEGPLKPIEPILKTAIVETRWPLQNNMTRDDYAAILRRSNYAAKADSPTSPLEAQDLNHRWAQRMLHLSDRGTLPTAVPILMQGIKLGDGLRLIALEGEPLHPHGKAIQSFYGNSVTFPVGYSNGEGIYLVTSEMLDEGGYEPESFWEYGWPSPLAKGMELVLRDGLRELQRRGIT